MDVVMTNLSEDDDSSWLYAQDVHSMHIADHLFGPNFLSSAIVMERVNVTLTPSVSISIMDSRFENEGSDYEMVTLSNVQPTDEVVLESDHFVHSFITISFGESDEAAVTHSLTVRDSHFSSMTSHSAIYLLDIDYNTTSAKQRGVSYFEDNRLKDCDGPSSLIEIAHLDNNDDDEDHYRVIVDANTFSDNVAVDDLIALRSLDSDTDGALSLYLVNNSFADNVDDSLLHCDGGNHIVNLSASTTPMVMTLISTIPWFVILFENVMENVVENVTVFAFNGEGVRVCGGACGCDHGGDFKSVNVWFMWTPSGASSHGGRTAIMCTAFCHYVCCLG